MLVFLSYVLSLSPSSNTCGALYLYIAAYWAAGDSWLNMTKLNLGLIMYILTTLKFPTHNFDFHLLTTSVNAKYYYL